MRLSSTPIASAASKSKPPEVDNSVVVPVFESVRMLRPATTCSVPLVEDTVAPLLIFTSLVAPPARKSTYPDPLAVMFPSNAKFPLLVTIVIFPLLLDAIALEITRSPVPLTLAFNEPNCRMSPVPVAIVSPVAPVSVSASMSRSS